MSESYQVDNDNDLIFVDGILQLITGNSEIVQAIRLELEQNKEQWLLNTFYGANWLNEKSTGILQNKSTKTDIENEIRRVINKYSEVTEIISFRFTDDNRIEVYAEINNSSEVITIG
jgi:translation initiation factor 2 beta subunit (eIF-2beta)/eIF-5